MNTCAPDPILERLSALAAQPGVVMAGFWDRSSSFLTSVDGEGREVTAATRVLVEAVLSVTGALMQEWDWRAPRDLRLACADGVLLIHCLEEGRCLILRHRAEVPSAGLGLVLSEAAARWPASQVQGESGLAPAADFGAGGEKMLGDAKSVVYNPFTPA